MALTLPGFGTLASCRLRLEDDVATDVGAHKPSDLDALQTVRRALVASTNGLRDTRARDIMLAQRRRLSATIQGLGGDPAENATPKDGPAWPASAQGWLEGNTLSALASLSEANAPMAFAIGATGIALAQRDRAKLSWPANAEFPHRDAASVAQAADAAVAALEWVGAHEKDQRRTDIAAALVPLYSARSLAQTGAQGGTPTAPARTFTSPTDALKVAKESLKATQSGCARACTDVSSPGQASAVLFVWAGATKTLDFLGVKPTAFDGLSDS